MSKKEKTPTAPATLPPPAPKAAPNAPKAEPPKPSLESLSKEQLIDQLKAAAAEIAKRERLLQAQAAQVKALATHANRLVNANLTLTETLAEARTAAQAAAAAKPAS